MNGSARGARDLLLPVLAALLVFLLHALLFGSWIVDDAGVSFAYARNLATGHGLVAQPGIPPVEGYSNFLWVLLLAPAILLRLFHPVFTPKALAILLVAGTFLLLYWTLAALTGKKLVAALPLLWLALDTSFVVWGVSGLENPLYAFLLALLFALLARERTAGVSASRASLAGAVAAGIALTRPDGLLFAVLYPLLTVFTKRPAGRRVLAYALAFGACYGGYLAFRISYFGDLFPNTYYAKGGPGAGTLLYLLRLPAPVRARIVVLLEGAAGPAGLPLLAALAAGTGFLLAKRRFRWEHGALLAFTAAGALVFLLLPLDWMWENRFATPFHLFFPACVVTLAAAVAETLLPDPQRRRLPALVATPLVLGWALYVFVPRSLLFASVPTVPFTRVEQDFGRRYNHFADLLGVRKGSILLPDVGGTLWASRLRVYDLGGLTDRTIARTRDAGHQAFDDYVFEIVKPTFIHTHDYWTLVSGFDFDPRLRRDYLPLFQRVEHHVVEMAGGRPLRSGDYVRRDIAAGHPDAVNAIRRQLADDYAREGVGSGPQGPGQ